MTGSVPTAPRRLSRRTRALLRRVSSTNDADRFALGGRLKSRHRPKAVTLPTIVALARQPDDSGKS
jgi:hypothetical protein